MFPRVYLGMIHAFQEIYKKEGVFNGFYRGFWAIGASTIIRAMVFPYCFNYIDFSLEFNRFRNSGADLL